MTGSSPDLSARQLRAVTALARNGSFIAAAAELGFSQPALTRTIKRAEAVPGIDLFTRSTRRVALTAAGREIVSLAERLLRDPAPGNPPLRHPGGRHPG